MSSTTTHRWKSASARPATQVAEVQRLNQDIRGYDPVKEEVVAEVRDKIAAHAIMRA